MDLYNPKMEIRELPTKIYKELCSLLDIPGEKDWKALVSVLPDGIYSKSQAKKLQNAAQNNGSPAEELLGELGSQSITVMELICYFELIDHQEALRLLKPIEILVHDMLLTAEEENFIKITKIILDIVPKYLRKLFVCHWDKTYPNHKLQSENLTVEFLLSRVPRACRHLVFVKKMKEESIEEWGSAALAFAFTDCGHRLIEGGRRLDERISPLRLSEELDIIKKIHRDFCSNPSSRQCSHATFTNVASQMKSLAMNVFGADAEREVNEIVASQMATDVTIEQLNQQLRKEGNATEEHDNLCKDLMFTMVLSAEEENFIKITKIVLDIVPKYLRRLFVYCWSKSRKYKWKPDDMSSMMLSTVPVWYSNIDIGKRHFMDTMTSVRIGEWNISTLLFAFLDANMYLVKGCRPVNKRSLPLRVSEEIDVIRMVKKDFFSDPSSMQCSSVTFTEVTSKIKSVARNIFDADAEIEIDEFIRSKITTTMTKEQLKKQLPKKNPINEHEKLFSEVLVQNIILTTEEENFIKIAKIILDIVPKYLRKLFIYQWNNTYPNHKWQSDNLSIDFLLSRVPKVCHDIAYVSKMREQNEARACRHLVFVKKMKEESIEEWGSAALTFAFTGCGHQWIEEGCHLDKRMPHLLLSEGIYIIRKVHSDFCSNPSSMQCSQTTFRSVTWQLKSLAIHIFGADAEREINEIINSQIATEMAKEQLKQQLPEVKNPNDELESLFNDVMFATEVSAEEENFIKITKIIFDIVPKYLRRLFIYYRSKWSSGRTAWRNDTRAAMLFAITAPESYNNIRAQHCLNAMKSVDVGEWDLSTLIFAFLESGMHLVKGFRPFKNRSLPLRVSEEIDVIRKVKNDFFADPSNMQCSSITFAEVTSMIKSVARNIFGVDAEHEIDEIIQSKITTTAMTIEQLKQHIPMKNHIG